MKLDWYYTFLVAAKYQNYRKAAEELFTTQTTVFNHIKNLEQMLNLKLFAPSGRNIILTSAGMEFLPYVKKIVQLHEDGIAAMRKLKNSDTVTLKIVVTSYIDNYLLPRFLPSFWEQNPKINLAITVSDDNFIDKMVNNNLYDVGIDRKEPTVSGLFAKNICEGKIQLAVPNLAENDILHTESDFFCKYPVITDNHPLYWHELKKSIQKIYPLVKFLSISSVRSTEDLIVANKGISYLPIYIIAGLNQNRIRLIPPQEIASPISHTYLMWNQNCHAIKVFINLFEKFIDDEKNKLH